MIGARDPRIRQRQQQRRVDEQVRPLLAKSFRPAPPVPHPLPEPRQVADLRRAHARVLEKQDAMALGRQRRHDLLMALPDEIPVDRRDAEDVVGLCHHVSWPARRALVKGLEAVDVERRNHEVCLRRLRIHGDPDG